MTYLNLDSNFAPYGKGIDFQTLDFPSGCEPHIKLQALTADAITITTRIQSSKDLMMLLLATDALKRSGIEQIHLLLPYLPFARQDRVMVPGEPLSVKVIADLLNLQGYKSVSIFDAHSEVSLALIDRSKSISNHDFAKKALEGKTEYLICSPDAGAYKKIFKLCQAIGYPDEIVLCNKIRDVSNGQIKKITVDREDLQGKDVYIVDDICDGGGTFVALAQALKSRNCGKIFLLVSHGIFSKGFDVLSEIEHIYTTDSFKDFEAHPKLTQIKLSDLFINYNL